MGFRTQIRISFQGYRPRGIHISGLIPIETGERSPTLKQRIQRKNRIKARRHPYDQTGNRKSEYHAHPGQNRQRYFPCPGDIPQYHPFLYSPSSVGRCGSGRMPPVRKAHSPGKGQKGEIFLFRQMPERMVECPPREGAAESLLPSDL